MNWLNKEHDNTLGFASKLQPGQQTFLVASPLTRPSPLPPRCSSAWPPTPFPPGSEAIRHEGRCHVAAPVLNSQKVGHRTRFKDPKGHPLPLEPLSCLFTMAYATFAKESSRGIDGSTHSQRANICTYVWRYVPCEASSIQVLTVTDWTVWACLTEKHPRAFGDVKGPMFPWPGTLSRCPACVPTLVHRVRQRDVIIPKTLAIS